MSDRRDSLPGTERGFGLYVHVPFCVHKCSYCDFYSFTQYGERDFEPFAEALCQEIEEGAHWLAEGGRELSSLTSVFFGGGTPSLLPQSALARVFETIARSFPGLEKAEVTLEANPETVTGEKVAGWRSLGINRVSLGAQSFDPAQLDRLERLARPESVRAAAALVGQAGFHSWNLDLMSSLPGQRSEEFLADIDEALRLRPSHLSFYTLTLKPGHRLFADLPDAETAADVYEAGVEALSRGGFEQYEISNFSRAGLACRHNLLYWSGGDYLGVGPSAASRLFREGAFHHRKRPNDYAAYLARPDFGAIPFESSTLRQTALEAAFLELRCNAGVAAESFSSRYGYDLRRASRYPLFLSEGLIAEEDGKIRLTPRGRLLADTVTADLVDWA